MKSRINLTIDSEVLEVCKQKFPGELSQKVNEVLRTLAFGVQSTDEVLQAELELDRARTRLKEVMVSHQKKELEQVTSERITREKAALEEKIESNFREFAIAEKDLRDTIELKYAAEKGGYASVDDYLKDEFHRRVEQGEWIL